MSHKIDYSKEGPSPKKINRAIAIPCKLAGR